MSWVRLHDGWNRNPKFAGMHRSARLLWVDLITYCREHLTDGNLTLDMVYVAAMDCPRHTTRKYLSLLVARGLLDVRSGGSSTEGPWEMHDYLDWNDSKEMVSSARGKTRERVAKYRESLKSDGACNGVTNAVTNCVTNADVTQPLYAVTTHAQPNPTQPKTEEPPIVPQGGPVVQLSLITGQTEERPGTEDVNKSPTSKSSGSGKVDQVFEYWREKHMPSAKKTTQRISRIRARLKEGYSVEDLCKAVDGVFEDDFLMGNNDRQTEYRDIKTIFRDGSKVENLIALFDKSLADRNVLEPKPRLSPNATDEEKAAFEGDPPGTVYPDPEPYLKQLLELVKDTGFGKAGLDFDPGELDLDEDVASA